MIIKALSERRKIINMGLFDSIKNAIASNVKQSVNASTRTAVNDLSKKASNAVHKAIANKSVKFTFPSIPTSVDELKSIPECKLDTPFKTAALSVLVLCNYGNNPEATYEMIEYLNGPNEVNERFRQFITDRLDCKLYKPFAFFEGATPKNGYKPNVPYTITVSDNDYSYKEEVWATLFVKSAGADSEAPIVLRKKPSTGQWFLNDIQCLADIRIPVEEDKWA